MKKSLFLSIVVTACLHTAISSAQKVSHAAKAGGAKIDFLTECNNELWFYSNFTLWKYQPGIDSADYYNVKRFNGVKLENLGHPKFGTIDGEMAVYNNKAFYLSFRGDMWVSDGTAGGTKALKQTSFSGVDNLLMCSTPIGVFASGGSKGGDLWKSDGSTNGTVKVKTLATGGENNRIYSMRYMLGKLYLTVRESGTTISIWSSDGTEAGTVKIADNIYSMSAGSTESLQKYATPHKGSVYFISRSSTDPSTTKVYKTDGTLAGTTAVINSNEIPNGVNGQLMSTETTLFIVANTVYSYDGTTVAAHTGTGYGTKDPEGIIAGDYLYFFSTQYNFSKKPIVYRTNGASGLADSITALPDDIQAYNLYHYKDTVYFFAEDFSNTNPDGQPWKTDGSSAGTVKLVIDTTCTGLTALRPNTDINLLRVHKNGLYFAGSSPKTSWGIFKLGEKDVATSIHHKGKPVGMSIYPNPSNGKVLLSNLPQGAEITVFNLLGEQVLTQCYQTGTEIDLSNQAKGIYLIRATHQQQTLNGKIVLE